MLDLETDNLKSFQAVQIIASRIWFHDEDHLRIINEHKIDCLFRLDPREPDEKDPSLLSFTLISAVKLDNMFTNLQSLDSGHFNKDPKMLRNTHILERLIRKTQNYKANVTHAKNSRQGDTFNILENIFGMDYL